MSPIVDGIHTNSPLPLWIVFFSQCVRALILEIRYGTCVREIHNLQTKYSLSHATVNKMMQLGRDMYWVTNALTR